jgi:hypothetical protein
MTKFLYLFILLSQVALAQVSTGGGGGIVFENKNSFREIEVLEKAFIVAVHVNSNKCKHAKSVGNAENLFALYENLIALEGLEFLNKNNIDSDKRCQQQVQINPSECIISGATKELVKLLRHPEFGKYLIVQLIKIEGEQFNKEKPKIMIDYFVEKLKKIDP